MLSLRYQLSRLFIKFIKPVQKSLIMTVLLVNGIKVLLKIYLKYNITVLNIEKFKNAFEV